MISPSGRVIRTSSPFRRVPALAAVSWPDVRSHLTLVRRPDGDELKAQLLGPLDEPVPGYRSLRSRRVSGAILCRA